MRQTTTIDNKSESKQQVFRYLLKYEAATKQDLFINLGLSLPTIKSVLENLARENLIEISGKIKNTGGRNASAYGVRAEACYAVGIYISTNHLTAAVLDLAGNTLCSRRIRKPLSLHDDSYLRAIGALTSEMIQTSNLPEDRLTGIGIAIPSMVSEDGESILFGMTHNYNGIDKKVLSRYIPYPTFLYHDSYAAGFSEVWKNPNLQNAVYLNLNTTVGSCIITDGKIYSGSNCRAGELGHIIVDPHSSKHCYCGQKGCLDTLCNTGILENHTDGNLAAFFEKLQEKDEAATAIWDTYTDHLALAVHNIRMIFDSSVIIGGYLGAHIGSYIEDLYRKVDQYRIFSSFAREYVQPCSYDMEATAAGAALGMIDRFIQML